MQFDNQITRNVAEVAAKIMAGETSQKEPEMLEEALKGQQHEIDKNKNNKIDAHDFAILRGEKKAPVKKEEVEQVEEASKKEEGKFHSKLDKLVHKTFGKSKEEVKKEEVEQVEEASYSATAARAGKDIGKPGKMFGKIAASAAKRYGSEERGKKVAGAILKKLRMKEDVDQDISDEDIEEILTAYDETPKTFSEMMAAYKEEGISFFAEEPTTDQYNAEIEDAKQKAEGKKKQPDLAKGDVQGVKQEQTHTEVEVIDIDPVNGVKSHTVELKDLEEKTLTEPEMKKKEEVVKSMKKGLEGFKARYGERAKNVMYATATKIAKEKA